ncbi:tetratricopeptide repeat protein [Candidatus Saccharibacteria bacterium]|jgi:tetratricopeptide (TPR) repeat protein|nr:tetratricopeptide repeat protein [Candidatus Saccharibacteria bacterium]HOR23482.1 tetratricopeptide repeat protein [Candidatus Saccharibacteria bacterium]HPW47923.1 tetratricopeptide repeat protein [Candidatus Saccharibacteria bacterium]
MIELVVILIIAAVAMRSTYRTDKGVSDMPERIGARLGRLWEIAYQGMRENKLLRAEKALLTILKIDQKNAAAYNRLGILYAKQKEFKDAIDCFEIASSIEKSASSLHNLGLIYYETGDYSKASVAFEEALQLEDNLAARHIAYAKVQEKLGNDKKMIAELEAAAKIEPNKETSLLLMKAYGLKGMEDKAQALKRSIKKRSIKAKPRKVIRPPRVVV